MNTNNVRSVLVWTHPATVAAALLGVVALALAVVLMVMLAMLTVSLALAWLVAQALADESRAVWRSLATWKHEQERVQGERPEPIVAPSAIPIPWGIPMDEPLPAHQPEVGEDAAVLLPDAHVVNPSALDGLADAMKGEPTPSLQAAELVAEPVRVPTKVKRTRKVKVKVAPTIPDWEGVTDGELVAQCKAKGIKANARWKRETLLARLRA